MAVTLCVDFADGRFDAETAVHAERAAQAGGYRLARAARADDRLAAWIDWQFAPSWWSSEARAGEVVYALGPDGEPAGFAAFDTHGLHFPWLRGAAARDDTGVFGPYGVAPAHRKTGIGAVLLQAALAALAARGYAHAVIPAVGYERLVAMYVARSGARIIERFEYTSPRRFRTTIMASGAGTNARSVIERVAEGRLALDIAQIVVNDPRAGVLTHAERAGIPAQAVVWDRTTESRAAYDARVFAAVEASQPDLVLLLGWMHVLPAAFVDRFAEILNVHPAFLPFDPQADDVVVPDGRSIPAFRGAHAVRDALAAGAQWSGASVHRVTALTDRGEILVRTPLPIGNLRGRAEVTERLRPLEHGAVTAAIRRWIFEHT